MKKQNANYLKLNSDELERYSRQILLPEIGEIGQKKLKNSSVLCVGCGGLGSPLLMYLAAAGVGHLGIVDSDLVEESNLQRQLIHDIDWISKSKIDSAKSRILKINPNCNVEVFNTLLTRDNALKILKPFDLICDCTDNFQSRYLINDACVILDKPNVYGAISKFEGQATVFNLKVNSPNFRDLVPEPPPQELLPSCSDAGVLGILPGIIGLIQATESIKIITGIGETLDQRLLVVNALKMEFKELKLYKNKKRNPINELINYEKFCRSNEHDNIKSISVLELNNIINNPKSNFLLIDVRSPKEYAAQSIQGSKLIPLNEFEDKKCIEKIKKLSKKKDIYIYCKSGSRSASAISKLKQHGIRATNIKGGIESWSNNFKN